MKFHVPNDRTLYRAESFMTKEPETIDWIDGFQSNSVFWDIGACVGTYSIYAAMRRAANVVAVEPSVFNLEWLARNICANRLTSKVLIVPIALTNKTQRSEFRMQVTEWGGALSSFGVTYDHEGSDFTPRFEYSTLGADATLLVETFKSGKPRYIKIDVDSIEHLVIQGLLPYLSDVESVALENSRNSEVVERCRELLTSRGFNVLTQGRANSIWVRKELTKI
jgi:FkbM family methyltransferase